MNALVSCRAKIDRAGLHLLPIHDEVTEFGRSDPYAISSQYDPNTRRQIFKIAQSHFDCVELGLHLGDAVHNLRCALDHLVWGLASANRKTTIPPKERRSIFFPVADTYQAFMTHPTIPYLTLDQIAVLQKYQAFSGGHDKRLRELNALWNADKHQVVQLVLAVLHQSGIKLRPNADAGAIVDRWFMDKIAFEPDAQRTWLELGWVEVAAPGPNPKVEVESLTVQIQVGERRFPAEDLVFLFNLVNEIVEECSPFLEDGQHN